MDVVDFQNNLDNYNDIVTQHYTSTVDLVNQLVGGFNIISLNIRSLKKHFDELILLILHDLKGLLDVVILTETWSDEASNIPHIDGYNVFSTHRSVSRADGVVVYVREKLQPHAIEYPVIDCNCLRLDISVDGRPLTIICVYRSQSITDVFPFLESISHFLSHNTHQKRVISISIS